MSIICTPTAMSYFHQSDKMEAGSYNGNQLLKKYKYQPNFSQQNAINKYFIAKIGQFYYTDL